MALSPGTRLGSYEILAPIGAGGMGEVYRARDRKLDRDVAIKVLPKSVAADPDALKRFEREAKAVAALSHPNILAIHDFGTHEGTAYAVMELLEGETLRDRLEGGPISEKQAVGHALQIAKGLSAAHENGIVHRDLKPENLFVSRDGDVKILDFGLAKRVQAVTSEQETSAPTGSALTMPGTVMGTVGYMSPEQVRGLPVDHRSDIFSFGAILYELFSGKRAFQRATTADTMSAILKEEPPALVGKPGVPSGLAAIVARCLEKSPEERFQSARDLALDMKALERASEASVPAAATVRRRRVAVLGVAAALLLLALAIGFWMTNRSGTAAPGRIDAIAVLPLANLGDREQDYFADGMTEALITELAQIRSLKVISRTSVMGYKGGKKPLPDLARELGVNGIVEGSVLRAGNRVRITAQLVHAPTDRHLWARSYERDLRDVLTLQGEVARGIAREIKSELTPGEERRLARSRPIDPKAYEEYLRGRYLWTMRTEERLKKSMEYFRRAIELEPAWGLAHAGLADAYQTLGNNGILPAKEAFPKARAGALKALELDPDLAEAHATLSGEMRDYEWDWVGAEREVKRALELNPSYATAHQHYAFYLVCMGRPREAVAAIERARELDPLSPRINSNVGQFHFFARDYEGAAEAFRKAVDLEPAAALSGLAYVYSAQGRHAEATAAADEGVRRSPLRGLLTQASVYAGAGRKEEARAQLTLREASTSYVEPTRLALACTALGEKERAINLLEKGFAERSLLPALLKGHPGFDPLRSDPLFADLLRRMGLPPDDLPARPTSTSKRSTRDRP